MAQVVIGLIYFVNKGQTNLPTKGSSEEKSRCRGGAKFAERRGVLLVVQFLILFGFKAIRDDSVVFQKALAERAKA